MNKSEECKIILDLFQLGSNTTKEDNSDKCEHKQCRSGKAFCLSDEQAFLISMLIDDGWQWDIVDGHINILENDFCRSLICKDNQCKETALLHDFVNESQLCEFISQNLESVTEWKKVCEPIVITMGINVCNEIVNRNTLLHLCMNSKYGAAFFRKVIMKVLNLLVLNWSEPSRMEAVADFFINFLNELLDYNYEDQETLYDNIKDRSDILCEKIRRNRLDILYKELRMDGGYGQIGNGDSQEVLEYLSGIEHSARIYYVSRLNVINYIFRKKEMTQRVPDSLLDFHKKPMDTGDTRNTRKIYEIIDSIARQTDDKKKNEWIDRLGKIIEDGVMDWIDEDIQSLHQKVIS